MSPSSLENVIQEILVIVSCDKCRVRETPEIPVSRSIALAIGRIERELDLCAGCQEALTEVLAEFLRVARKTMRIGESQQVPKATPDVDAPHICHVGDCRREFSRRHGLGVHQRRTHGLAGRYTKSKLVAS